ncbi:hypothetical protein [Lysobacter tyrosinilyticus]
MSFLTIALWVLSAAGVGMEAPPLDQLQGTWIGESRVYRGKLEGSNELKDLKLVIEGQRFTYHGTDGTQLKGLLAFPGPPGEVDTIVIADDGQRKIVPSLYRLDGDVLKVARPQGDAPARPFDFTSSTGSNVRVTVYRRGR